MEQQVLAIITSSSSSVSTKRYKVNQGILSYSQGDRTEWHKLDEVLGTGRNINHFTFDFSLELFQWEKNNRCTLKYPQGSYADARFDLKSGQRIELLFTFIGTSVCNFSGDENKAKGFPLAKMFGSFTYLKIEFRWDDFKPKFQGVHACRQELSHLTRGSVMQLPESNEAMFLEQMRTVTESESKAQEELIGTQKDCHMRTSRWRKSIVVQLWPFADSDNADLEVIRLSLSDMHYLIYHKVVI